MFAIRLLVLALAGSLFLSNRAHADEAPVSRTGRYSRYEQETINDALKSESAALVADPEGKIIESIDALTLEVIEKRDPAPAFLNVFHGTTRQYIVKREVLVHVGEPYRKVLVDESARNLRGLGPFSLVLCIAVEGSSPDRVRLLVVTKDVWSLRINSDFRLVGGKFEYLLLQPSEQNILGLTHTAAAQFILEPLSTAIGLRYSVPRVAGTRISTRVDSNVIVNRESGKTEGSFGTLNVAQPLFSTRTEWSWLTSATWRNEVTRRYSNGELLLFTPTKVVDSASLKIPFQYRSATSSFSTFGLRSFGWANKLDVSVGVEGSRRKYDAGDLSGYNPEAARQFQLKVPTDDTRIGPYVQVRSYRTDFMRVLDLETLGLQEDYRLGHDSYLKLYPVFRALGSTRNFLGIAGGAQLTLPLRDGLIRGAVEGMVESDGDTVADASIDATLRIASPRAFFGRIVFDARIFDRLRNSLNRRTTLGGDTRLRGYPSKSLLGQHLVASNLELRTKGLELFSCQVGAALFYDAGDAFDNWSLFHLKHSVGAGLRVLFPQLDRIVLRADFGVALDRAQVLTTGPYELIVTFGQPFAMPTL